MPRSIGCFVLLSVSVLLGNCTQTPLQKVCIDFDSLNAGEQFGAPVGNMPGDLITRLSKNGITVSAQEFVAINGSAFGFAYIDGQRVPTGSGQSLRTNNMNMLFDFTNIGFSISRITLGFDDFGGSENIAVNGLPVPPIRELTSQPLPTTIGGVAATAKITEVSVSVQNSSIKNRYGSLELNGAVQSLLIGGQELWIDELCAEG